MPSRAPGIMLLIIPVLLGGCSVLGDVPSPRSTYVDVSGEPVTVFWKDYPASAGVDGEVLLRAPDQTELEAPARELVQDLRHAVETSSGVTLTPAEPERSWFGDESWHVETDNGYGGRSMLTTVNCCTLAADRAPDPARWPAVLDAAGDVTREAGMGPLVLQHESETMAQAPGWLEDFRETYCNAPGGECWTWRASAYDGAQWVDVTIEDASLDPTGAGFRDAEELDLPPASITIEYGATVVRAGMRAEYEQSIAPFLGLEQPEATTSD